MNIGTVMTRDAQYGASLVELMVAMVIGLLITHGATRLFMDGSQVLASAGQLAERQNTLNMLFELVSRDVRAATGRVTPVQEGVPTMNSDHLLIEFHGTDMAKDPYCSSDRLEGLEYYQETRSSDVMLRVRCRNDEDRVYDRASQPIVSNLMDLHFEKKKELEEVVAIEISASTMRGTSSHGDHGRVSFLVVNRKSVIDRIE
ncbi:PilW family protein [Aidingimonas lacisalsi]|uniref:PilW family protein n=1 Tax=Aidingimonas lacisalsi TaxID=2604086 RepID=UPI0011D2A43A|nr:prepilin-type N-terminal cleavage/methylation domain-containing protein [Aidingimonas lacisalsi]